MKIIFFGNYLISLEVLRILWNRPDVDVCAVVTRPEYKTEDGSFLNTPVDRYMNKLGHGARVIKAEKCCDTKVIDFIKSLDLDLLICVSYSSKIPKKIFEIPRLGSYNFHPSLLPRWRGADPIRRAIYHGDTSIGVSVHAMDEAFDSGDIALQESIDLERNDTLKIALDKICYSSKRMVNVLIEQLLSRSLKLVSQDEKDVTYAHPLKEYEKKINPLKEPKRFFNLFRALYPFEYPIVDTNDGPIIVKQCKCEKQLRPECLISIKMENEFLCIC